MRNTWRETPADKIRFKVIVAVVAFTVLVVLPFGCISIYRSTSKKTTITVKDKERVTESDGSSTYLVFCESEVFENADSISFWKWSSSDLYGQMDEGKTYDVTVAGWRLPLLSMYRNIITIDREVVKEEVEDEVTKDEGRRNQAGEGAQEADERQGQADPSP